MPLAAGSGEPSSPVPPLVEPGSADCCPPESWPCAEPAGAGVEPWSVEPSCGTEASGEGVAAPSEEVPEPESVEGAGEGVVEPDFEEDEPCPVRASLTVVAPPPLKVVPDTISYVVMPAIVTPKTRAAATTGRFQLLTLAR
ncbi:hypothetical protein WN71_013835 [Streptomyces mangrovisoli]|uniref:Uncharacterized protein n=1 Tax=Streptomyces mangrovisoli TaxID=1428628 RepID=A0A1J4P1M3_9ACTN|nr:hypothetical protein WN71_013835 [Streptomyces mangrovisoli]